jgi:release factor glutamine methyltransferase
VNPVDNDETRLTVFPGVYPPSEDTYLLMDALQVEPDDVFLEVGSGAGLITLAAAKKAKTVISIDISLAAVQNTKENLEKHGLYDHSQVIESDLLNALSTSFKFSLIVFNPPYLPQDDEYTDLDNAFVGGPTGAELTLRFIRQAEAHLCQGGRILVVVSSLADVDLIQGAMTKCGFVVERVSESSMFFEKIQVLRGVLKEDHREMVL